MTKVRKIYCTVPGCKNTSSNSQLVFHMCPKDDDRRKRWAESLTITKNLTSNMFICSAHFSEKNYFIIRASTGEVTRSKKLKKTALPVQIEKNKKTKHLPIILHKRSQKLQNIKSSLINIKTNKDNKLQNDRSVVNTQKCGESNEKQSGKILSDQVQTSEITIANDTEEMDARRHELLRTAPLQDPDSVTNCSVCRSAIDLYSENELDASELLLDMESMNIDRDISFKIDCADFEKKNTQERVIQILEAETKNEAKKDKKVTLLSLIKTDEQLVAFTGINFHILNLLSETVKLCEDKHHSNKFAISVEDRIVLCLTKLRINISFICLSVLFQVNRRSCSNIFYHMVSLLSQITEKAIYWPTDEEFKSNLPKCFKNFSETKVVLDCTEIPSESPHCLTCRLKLYSHYKGGPTLKLLLGITPSGLISFVSKPYGGRASDKAIFVQSGILNKLVPTRHAIMVDKGFDIEVECAENHIKLLMPPKLGKRKQFTKSEMAMTEKIAAARVHVERTIQRFKMFKILQGKISWEMMPHMPEIIRLIASLVNMKQPILADDKF